jgi:hypothetical protein
MSKYLAKLFKTVLNLAGKYINRPQTAGTFFPLPRRGKMPKADG